MATENNFKVKKGLDVLGGDINLGSGFSYKIDGTTVIDSSGSFGNISTGSITATGHIITNNNSRIENGRISMEADGTLDWGAAKDSGTLTWDTGKIIVRGLSGNAIELQTNGSSVAATFDTSQNATFKGKLKVEQAGTGTTNTESSVAALSGQNQGGTLNALSLVNSVTGANSNGVALSFHNGNAWSATGRVITQQESSGSSTDSRMIFQVYRGGLQDALILDHDENATFGGNITANTITTLGSFTTSTASSSLGIYAGSTQVFEGSTRNLKNLGNITSSSGYIQSSTGFRVGSTEVVSSARELKNIIRADFVSFAVTGTSTTAPSYLRYANITANPEGSHMSHPYFFNDLANFVPRGGSIAISGLSFTPDLTQVFKANPKFASWAASNYSGSTMTITLTSIPSNLSYGGYIGIAFGNTTWAPASCKIEVSTDGGTNWTTRLNDSSKKELYFTSTGAGATSINAIRFTLGQPSSSLRLTNIWAYNYQSNGMENYFLSKGGGTVWGDVVLADNVGIGHDSFGFNSAGLPLVVGGGSGNTGMTIFSGANSVGSIHFTDSEVTSATSYIGYINYNHTSNYMRFGTNADERVRIDSSGNVGIGTASPTEKLHVVGGALFTNSVTVGDSTSDALITTGVLKVGLSGGTTVIDASRNLTNIGTISSGAITATGNSFIDRITLKASGGSGTAGGRLLDAHYTGDDHLWTLSSDKSSGALTIGYGADSSTSTSQAFTSTFDNFSGNRSAVTFRGDSVKFWGTNAGVQTTVGSELTTMTNRITLHTDNGNIDTTGVVTWSGGSSTNANTAYGWGNHASAGYLTSFDITTQTDPKYLRSDAADTATGKLTLNGGLEVLSGTGGGALRIKRNSGSTTGDDVTDIHMDDNSLMVDIDNDNDGDGGNFYFRRKAAGAFAVPNMYLGTNQRVFADNYHPNADKWTTARTITLGGDLTGNVSIDGSANVTLSASVANDSHTHDTRYAQLSANNTFSGNNTFNGTVYGIYHAVEEDHYYFDDYNGTRNINAFLKTSRSDIIKYQDIGVVEYWNGSSWVDATSTLLSDVEKLLDGRQDTTWFVPSTYYKFRFTVTASTSWPTRANIGMQTSWTGSTYPGSTLTVEELQTDSSWATKVTAEFTSSNGVNNWGTAFRSDSALHTGRGSQTYATRITVDFYGWTPSNSSYTTIPLQNIFIYSNYSGTETNDYQNLLEYSRKITAPNGINIATSNLQMGGTTVISSSRNATLHDISFDGVVSSTNNANADGPNFNVSTTNKSTSEYAYRVDRSGSVVGGIRIDGRLIAPEATINGSSVTSTLIGNWNTAYSWGNHASAGYLTSYTETDTLASVTGRGATTTNAISTGAITASGTNNTYAATFTGATGPSVTSLGLNVKTLDGTNDVALLVEKTDGTDLFKITGQGVGSFSQRISVQSQDITSTRIQNWQTAYGWGDHSTQGYLTSYSETDTLDSVTTRGATTTNSIGVGSLSTTGSVTLNNNQKIYFKNASGTSNSFLYRAGGNATRFEYADNVFIFDSADDADFEVRNSGDATVFKVAVNSTGSLVSVYTTGNFNANQNIQTNSTTRITNNGNLTNIGSITAAGNITTTETLQGDIIRLTNDSSNTARHRISVYDSGTTSYGMMLWNSNGTGGDWSTMIYGPNQANRRISFGKITGSTFATHADVTESMFLDLDNDYLFIKQRVSHYDDDDTYVQFDNNRVRLVAGGTTKFDSNNTYQTTTAPNAVSITSTSVVSETVEIVFSQSSSSNVSHYEIWSDGGGTDFSLIGKINNQDAASSMSFVDTTFTDTGTINYRIYVVSYGVYSTAATTSASFSTPTLDVTNFSAIADLNNFYLQYEKPDTRFLDHIEIYVDTDASSANLARANATLIYSGDNSSYVYTVSASDRDNFHQFWVECVGV